MLGARKRGINSLIGGNYEIRVVINEQVRVLITS